MVNTFNNSNFHENGSKFPEGNVGCKSDDLGDVGRRNEAINPITRFSSPELALHCLHVFISVMPVRRVPVSKQNHGVDKMVAFTDTVLKMHCEAKHTEETRGRKYSPVVKFPTNHLVGSQKPVNRGGCPSFPFKHHPVHRSYLQTQSR